MSFSWSTITQYETKIQAVHISELKTNIDHLRTAHVGLSAYTWTRTPAAGSNIQQSASADTPDFKDLRKALDEAYDDNYCHTHLATHYGTHLATHYGTHLATHNGSHLATHNGTYLSGQNVTHYPSYMK